MPSTPDSKLDGLINRLRACAPAERIGLRNDILAFGADCIGPLKALAEEDGGFAASVASWLEVLAKRDSETRPAVVDALADIASGIDGYIARDALVRLGAAGRVAKSDPTRPIVRSTAEMEVHARIIKVAQEGRVVFYSDLETNRSHIGKYLLHISQAEAEAGHPPLTAIVISKTSGRPGDGFLPAMLEVGYAHPGETLDAVWKRAVADVHEFWREHEERPRAPW